MTPVEAQVALEHVAPGWLVTRKMFQPELLQGWWHFTLYRDGRFANAREVRMHEDELRDRDRCRAAFTERMAA